MATFEATYTRVIGVPPPAHLRGRPLAQYWNRPVSSLCALEEEWHGADEENERHRVYARLLMAIVYEYWNGYKYGRRGTYPQNDPPGPTDPMHLDREYYGHNIAALAVDERGHVLDFDFNHNEVLSSSAEHAEARLIRRLYSLSGIRDPWEAGDAAEPSPSAAIKRPYVTMRNATVYTSLESCSQCAGIMALAQVGRVVYLQTDPGTYWIGRLLRNLTTDNLRAPLPISGNRIDLHQFAELDGEYEKFVDRKKPFWEPPKGKDPTKPDTSTSVTSFLCTSTARSIFCGGGDQLQTLKLQHPEFRPFCEWPSSTTPHACGRRCALSTAQVLEEAMHFLSYAKGKGRRGTTHNM